MVIAETFVVAETLWIPMRAIEVGREIISMIEADRDKKGILQEIGNKIQNVNNVLELIEKNQISVDTEVMKDVVKGLNALQEEVQHVKNIGRFMYLLQRKDCQEKLNNKVSTVQFYLHSLNTNQASAVFEETDKIKLQNEEIKMILAQLAVRNDANLEEQLKTEREQAEELRRQVDAQELQLQQLQEMGLGTTDELKLALKDVEDEQKHCLEDTEGVKSRLEAEYLENVIQLLQAVEVSSTRALFAPEIPTRTFIVPNCPISLQPLHDPVVVDCDCRRSVSRSSFKEWLQHEEKSPTHGGPPKCPLCGKQLHSLRVSPNVELRETLEAIRGSPSPHDNVYTGCVSTHDTQSQTLHDDDVKKFNAEPQVLQYHLIPTLGRGTLDNWIQNPVDTDDIVKNAPAQQEKEDGVDPSSMPSFKNCAALLHQQRRQLAVSVFLVLVLFVVIMGIGFGVLDWGKNPAPSTCSSCLVGEAAGDSFGCSVALSKDGSRVAIGARRNDGNGDKAGHVRIYERTGSQWIQMGSEMSLVGASPFRRMATVWQ